MLIDIFFLILVLVCALIGKSRGLVKSLLGAVSVILAIVITMSFNEPLTESLMKTRIYENIREDTLQKVTPKIENRTIGENNILKSFLDRAVDSANTLMADSIAAAADNISKSLLTLFVSVILFIASLLIIRVATRFVDKIFRLPVLNFVNSLGGMVWGVLVALIITYVSLAVVSSLALFNDSGAFSKQFESSIIVKKMYEKNPVTKYFM